MGEEASLAYSLTVRDAVSCKQVIVHRDTMSYWHVPAHTTHPNSNKRQVRNEQDWPDFDPCNLSMIQPEEMNWWVL